MSKKTTHSTRSRHASPEPATGPVRFTRHGPQRALCPRDRVAGAAAGQHCATPMRSTGPGQRRRTRRAGAGTRTVAPLPRCQDATASRGQMGGRDRLLRRGRCPCTAPLVALAGCGDSGPLHRSTGGSRPTACFGAFAHRPARRHRSTSAGVATVLHGNRPELGTGDDFGGPRWAVVRAAPRSSGCLAGRRSGN